MSVLAFSQQCPYLVLLERAVSAPVHCRAGEAEARSDCAISEYIAAEHHPAVCVACVHDAQRLVQPVCVFADELGDAGNGRAGVDEGEAVVVVAAAVREYG